MIDDTELKEMQSTAAPIVEQIAAGQYDEAVVTSGQIFCLVTNYSNGIDLYNFLVFSGEHCVPRDKRARRVFGECFTVLRCNL